MQYKKTEKGWLLRLLRDEEIISSLTKFAMDKKIESGFLFGLGAVYDPKIGYYDLTTKQYYSQILKGDYEILNLTGNISAADGKPVVHAHITLSDQKCQALGGHLFGAKIYATGEIWIAPFDLRVERKLDTEIGLKLLDLGN
ncbi:MAG: DNA-binding protein [candidate division Zixibacteria bacterium]|nr:DNA-binding protein [candidate division Zixibacteria bacterium]